MTRLGFALSMAALVCTAAWAYHVNYRTKTALQRIDKLRAEIAAEREAAETLRVDWAYLNAPDRLAELVALNNQPLGLEPMRPQNFDGFELIPFRRNDLGADQSAPDTTIVQVPLPEHTQPTQPQVTVPLPPPRPVAWRRQ